MCVHSNFVILRNGFQRGQAIFQVRLGPLALSASGSLPAGNWPSTAGLATNKPPDKARQGQHTVPPRIVATCGRKKAKEFFINHLQQKTSRSLYDLIS